MIESSDKNPSDDLNNRKSSINETDLIQKYHNNDRKNNNEDDQLVGNEDDLKNSQKWVKFDSRTDVKTDDDRVVTDNLDEIKLDNSSSNENNHLHNDGAAPKDEPAVLDTQIIHVTIQQPKSLSPELKQVIPIDEVDSNQQPSIPPRLTNPTQSKTSGPAVIDVPLPQLRMNGYNDINSHEMRTVDLSNAKYRGEGFSNGDKIVSLPPVSSGFLWIKSARFKPELVPEELMAQGLTVSVLSLIPFFVQVSVSAFDI